MKIDTCFYRGCDRCDEWFHGDCIGLMEDAANDIENYYCKFCRSGQPFLFICIVVTVTNDGSSIDNLYI